jgi:O-acetyl-ADP-ribose deacetylase (regulator of RNase III)
VIEVVAGDLTLARADAIVCPTDTTLRGGALAAALHAAAGSEVREACARLGGCPVGEARTTTAGALNARVLVHVVPPIWQQGTDRDRLAAVHRAAFADAAAHGCERVALPAIGTGGSKWPVHIAAKVAVDACADAVEEGLIAAAAIYVTDDAFTAYDAELLYHRPLPLRAARASDWRLAPPPPLRPLPFTRALDAAQARALSLGLVPEEMEEKWFVYRDGATLFLHRSWTGNLIFRVTVLEGASGSVTLHNALANADPQQFTATDAEAVTLLGDLVDYLANRG